MKHIPDKQSQLFVNYFHLNIHQNTSKQISSERFPQRLIQKLLPKDCERISFFSSLESSSILFQDFKLCDAVKFCSKTKLSIQQEADTKLVFLTPRGSKFQLEYLFLLFIPRNKRSNLFKKEVFLFFNLLFLPFPLVFDPHTR